MKARIFAWSIHSLAAVLLCGPPAAHASLSMSVNLRSINQLGDGSTAVSLGHAVLAGTNYDRLIAGGSFNASCVSAYTGTISAERTLTSALISRYNQLYVNIPEDVPAVRNMPGFENVPA